MIKKLLFLTFLTLTLNLAHAQFGPYQQYFDGADTLAQNSIFPVFDTSSTNIWQIGPPQKTIFDGAATTPNVLVTDTINTYPKGNTSSFQIQFGTSYWKIALYKVAFRWKQKLDLDTNHDGAIVEYSLDTGATWVNVFNNPNVYNFYGFDSLTNKDTLQDGTFAFSGTDTTWRDIWLCFDGNVFNGSDSFFIRYTLRTDTADNNKEGWMIDNMMAQPTYFHTVSKIDPDKSFIVYPTITAGPVTINSADNVSRLDNVQLVDATGKLIREYIDQPKKVKFDFSNCSAGTYYLKVRSKDKTEIHQVVIMH